MHNHKHRWVLDHVSCCYVLRCTVPGCDKTTTAYHVDGPTIPKKGERVEFLSRYSETIRVLKKKEKKYD